MKPYHFFWPIAGIAPVLTLVAAGAMPASPIPAPPVLIPLRS